MSILLAWVFACFGIFMLLPIVHFDLLWHRRQLVAGVVIGSVIAGVVLLAGDMSRIGILSLAVYILLLAVTLFLVARLVADRLSSDAVRRTTVRDVRVLIVISFLIPLSGLNVFTPEFIELLIAAGLVTAIALGTYFILQTSTVSPLFTDTNHDILHHRAPSVTIAIPARNETHELAHCLDAALASDYPKLEIVVLDDCSQDKTSQLIRSYAHAGVRFVQGEAPSMGAFGKNNAYAELLKQASGSYIMFMGVDTHVAPSTVSQLVALAEKKQHDMVSILPIQRDDFLLPSMFAALRSVWEILLPVSSTRVPVATQSWLVRRSALTELGGFDNVQDTIIPERRIAAYFESQQRYKFIIASGRTAVSYGKKWSSQVETAIRLLYPSCRKQPLVVLGIIAALLVLGIGPFIMLFIAAGFLQTLAFVASATYIVAYAIILRKLQPRTWWLSSWLLPAVLLQEIVLLLTSMYKYEFATVNWKGRNVCYPVLRPVTGDIFTGKTI